MKTPPLVDHDYSAGTHDHLTGDTSRVAADALSAVLQDLRLRDASHCRTEMRAPWGIEIPKEDGAAFHLVIEGSCFLQRSGAAPQRLEAGDVVLLPHGEGHSLLSSPGGATRRLHELEREKVGEDAFELHGEGPGEVCLLVCCGVAFQASALHPLLRLMPDALLVRRGGLADPSLTTVLDLMALEVRDRRMGAATIVARLADIVVTRVVRAWAEDQPEATTGWLAAIHDPQIGSAIAEFHRSPELGWTVEALAAASHLSRSQFTERFTAAVGVAPARYVASFRMHLAKRWLAAERLSVGEVAARLGYESEPAFSRAFKRIVGKPPSELRHRAVNFDPNARPQSSS
jgi:AraC-like DNA-binding protein